MRLITLIFGQKGLPHVVFKVGWSLFSGSFTLKFREKGLTHVVFKVR